MRFIGKFVILIAIFVFSVDIFAEAISPFPAVATSADCITGYGRLLTKEEIVVGRHISVKGADGKPIEARIVSVDPKDGVAVLVRPESPEGTYRFLTDEEAAAVRSSANSGKIPSNRKETNFFEKLLVNLANPFEPLAEVTHENFREWKSIQLRELVDLGVRLREIGGVDIYTMEAKSQNVDAIRFVSTLRQVTGLPPPGTDTAQTVNAILHPKVGVHLKELERAGYKLVYDLTLPFAGGGAYLDEKQKILALSHDSDWSTFLHEFEHFKIEQFIAERAKFLRTLKSGKAEEVLPKEIAEAIGRERLAKLNSLEQRGNPYTAYHERMAVDAQMRALGWRRYFSKDAYFYQGYQLSHRIVELANIPNRTPEQSRELWKAISGKVVNRSAVFAINRPIVTAGIAVAAYYRVKSLMVSEENGDIYVEDEKGSWTHLRSDERR